MPYFYRRGSTWSFRLYGSIDPKTGKKKQIGKSGFATKRDAVTAAAALETALNEGTYIADSSTTFKDFATEWIDEYALSVKPASVRIRRHQIALLLEGLAGIPLQSVTGRIYQRTLNALAAAGYSVRTLEGVHTAAHMIFKKAREYKIIRDDPTEFARPPRPKTREIDQVSAMPRYLEKDELIALLDAAHISGAPGEYAGFLLLAYTGMRIGEFSALLWDDVDLAAATVSISKTLYCPDNNTRHYTLESPKTVSGYRVIDIPAEVVDALRAWRKEYAAAKIHFAPIWCKEHDFLFYAPNVPGFPLLQKTVQWRLDRLQKHLSLSTRVTPHVFRHTHISLLAEAGVQLHEIMERVGQIDENTTKKIYLHVTQHRKKEACRLFSNLMTTARSSQK